MLDATRALNSAPKGGWATLSVPLTCFAHARGISSVAAPFALRTDGRLTIALADIRLVHAAVRQCRAAAELK